jgi:hypothetical protein
MSGINDDDDICPDLRQYAFFIPLTLHAACLPKRFDATDENEYRKLRISSHKISGEKKPFRFHPM